MYGLTPAELQDLRLSVNTHQRSRRLEPSEVGLLIAKALSRADVKEVAEILGFRDTSMLRRFASLVNLPPELQRLVSWGKQTGRVSFSVAAELGSLGSTKDVAAAFVAALKHEFTKEEARQLRQASRRGMGTVDQCIAAVLSTRAVIERRELILGAVTDPDVSRLIAAVDPSSRDEVLRRAMREQFPQVELESVGLGPKHFSLLLSGEDNQRLQGDLNKKSIEEVITDVLRQCLS